MEFNGIQCCFHPPLATAVGLVVMGHATLLPALVPVPKPEFGKNMRFG